MSKGHESASIPQVYAFPATPLQERIWLLEENHVSNPAWNVAVRFQLVGTLSLPRFQRAINEVVAQTEILRTGFALLNGELKQVIPDSLTIPLGFIDFSDSNQFDQELDAISQQEAEAPFQMGQAPLLRVVLVRRDYQAHILLVTAHHAILDGYSVGLLSDALLSAYAEDDDRETTNGQIDAPLQFADYAIWLNEHRNSLTYRDHASYWKGVLDGATEFEVARPSNTSTGSAHIESILLPRSLTNTVQQLSQRLEVTFSQVALAVMACTVYKQNGIIGVPVACRSQVQLEQLIGPVVNYLPLRITSEAESSFDTMVAQIAEISNEALTHSEYRYEDMLEAKGIFDKSLFDTVFICQRDFVQPRLIDGLELTAIPSVSPGALHKLTVFLVERRDGWRLSCETDQQSSKYAGDLLRRYQAILQAVCKEPGAPLSSLCDICNSTTLPIRPQDEIFVTKPILEERTFPASATQERYWSLDRIDPGNSKLNLHIQYTVEGILDCSVFRRALHALGLKHDALRTSFFEVEGHLQQRVSACFDVPLRHIDGVDEDLSDEALKELFESQKRLTFNLQRDPLWSALLVTYNTHSYFSLTFAHSICDGWSCGILMRDLLALYETIAAGRIPENSLRPLSFGEMVADEHISRQTHDFSIQLAYWDNVLTGAVSNISLPADHNPGSDAVVTKIIDPVLAMTVTQVARDFNVTTASVYAAAYRALLFKYTGEPNLLLASPMANRFPGTENIVGPFADTLLLRADVGKTFEDALQATQNTLLAASENNVPLQYLMDKLQRLNAERGPSISIGFMYQEAFVRDLEGDHLKVQAKTAPVTDSSYDWHMAVIDRNGEVSIEFTPPLFRTSNTLALAILEDFELSLSCYVIAPKNPLAKIAGNTPRVLQICEAASRDKENTDAIAAPISTLEMPPNDSETIINMVQVWKTVFGRQQITPNDNFFALGGHSLLLARLQVAIEKQFGYRIFVADIFAAPTCALLVQRMANKEHSKASFSPEQVIPLQPLGDDTPLFLISQSMIMRELAERLGGKRPSYTIQFTQEDVERIGRNATMEQVATLYIEYLRKVRPAGPYRLGGWCVSGWVAYEMAQQLRAAGEDVELLLILDAWAPNFWKDLRGVARILSRCSYYVHRIYFKLLFQQSPPLTVSAVLSSLHVLQQAIHSRARKMFWRVDRKPQEPTSFEEFFDQMMESAVQSYRPAPYVDNRTIVFRSEEQPRGGMLPNDMGWRRLLPPEVKVISLAGDHVGMFSGPGAVTMAQSIVDKVSGRPTTLDQVDVATLNTPSALMDVPSCLS